MKAAMKALATAGLVSVVATATFAETAMEFAFRHFNDSAHSASDIRHAPETQPQLVTVSQMGQSSLGTAVRILNQSADSQSDLVGTNGLTVVPSEPAYAAEIFEQLREESRGDE